MGKKRKFEKREKKENRKRKRLRRDIRRALLLSGITTVQTFPLGIDYSTEDFSRYLANQMSSGFPQREDYMGEYNGYWWKR